MLMLRQEVSHLDTRERACNDESSSQCTNDSKRYRLVQSCLRPLKVSLFAFVALCLLSTDLRACFLVSYPAINDQTPQPSSFSFSICVHFTRKLSFHSRTYIHTHSFIHDEPRKYSMMYMNAYVSQSFNVIHSVSLVFSASSSLGSQFQSMCV